MKKVFLVAFIVLDVALMGASAFVLYLYLNHRLPTLRLGAKKTTAALPAGRGFSGGLNVSTPAVSGTSLLTVPAGSPGSESGTRKILFSYRNPKAKLVSIRADFTGWKGEPMQKGEAGVWTYQAQLTPGEYAYCFTADDRTFKDPANKRTKQIGRTFVSAIVVEPLPAVKPLK